MKRRYLLLLLSLLLATSVQAITVTTFDGRVINAQVASADYTPSGYIDASTSTFGSVQCLWASLTGTLDGQFIVEVSNNDGTTWTAKSGAAFTVSGATGNDSISLNAVVSEDRYRVRWVHNNVSGGTVNCYATFKG